MPDEFRTRTEIVAECVTCGEVWGTRNAHGLAVQHARKYGHRTIVDRTITYVYDHTDKGVKKK